MGFSPGEFSGYALGAWEDNMHWEVSSINIRLWTSDEMTLLAAWDVKEARKALDQLTLLVEMMESK